MQAPGQGVLDFGGPPPGTPPPISPGGGLHRTRADLLFMTRPPGAEARRAVDLLSILRDRDGMGGRDIKAACLHVTLAPVGLYSSALAGIAIGIGAAVMDGLARNGIRQRHAFSPHMTLQYGRRLLARKSIPRISWTVREFALVRSHIGKGRHETLESWVLP